MSVCLMVSRLDSHMLSNINYRIYRCGGNSPPFDRWRPPCESVCHELRMGNLVFICIYSCYCCGCGWIFVVLVVVVAVVLKIQCLAHLFRCEAKNRRSVIISVNMRDHRKLLIIYRSPYVYVRRLTASDRNISREWTTRLWGQYWSVCVCVCCCCCWDDTVLHTTHIHTSRLFRHKDLVAEMMMAIYVVVSIFIFIAKLSRKKKKRSPGCICDWGAWSLTIWLVI